MVERDGFEPSKAEPSDLQSDSFDHSETSPKNCSLCCYTAGTLQNREICNMYTIFDILIIYIILKIASYFSRILSIFDS